MIQMYLEPQTPYKCLFQLDDSKSLPGKWLEITKHPFETGCLHSLKRTAKAPENRPSQKETRKYSKLAVSFREGRVPGAYTPHKDPRLSHPRRYPRLGPDVFTYVLERMDSPLGAMKSWWIWVIFFLVWWFQRFSKIVEMIHYIYIYV